MYKNLCTDGLGVSMRQNELIELALTYGFNGIEIDMADMAGRAESMGHTFATQFVNSASVEVGTFGLPCDLGANDDEFANQKQRLELVCELAKSIEAKHCYINISPEHESLTYHENFEKHRARISEIADRMADVGTRCGLKLNAVAKGEGMQFIHKAEELLALVKTIDHDNLGCVFDTWHWQVGQFDKAELKSLDVNKITEFRFADPPENYDAKSVDPAQRLVPGTHPDSLWRESLAWLQDNQYAGPIALTAHVPVSTSNPGDNLFQRIAVVLDRMIAGQEPVPPAVPTQVETEAENEPVSTAAE